MPFIHLMQAQEKDLLRSLRTLLVDDLYAAIPELNPNHKHSRPARSAKKSHRPKRKKPIKKVDKVKRVVSCDNVCDSRPDHPGCRNLSSWIKGKQNRWIDNAVTEMRRSDCETRNELQQYRDDFLMYGKYSTESE